MAFRTEAAFIAPLKYPTLSLVALAAGRLTRPRMCQSLNFRLQDRQAGPGHLSATDMRRRHRGHCGPAPKRGFPGQKARAHRGRGKLVGCRPGACVCDLDRPGGEALTSPWRRTQRHLSDCRALQGHIRVRRRHGYKIIDEPLARGFSNWPRLEKGMGKKRAAGVPAASVATPWTSGARRAARPRPSAPLRAS
jgi:hypothetical protein